MAIPLSIMSSRFIHIFANCTSSFLFKAEYFIVCIYIPHLFYPLIHRQYYPLILFPPRKSLFFCYESLLFVAFPNNFINFIMFICLTRIHEITKYSSPCKGTKAPDIMQVSFNCFTSSGIRVTVYTFIY